MVIFFQCLLVRMGSDERFTAAEWYEFLVNEVKLPQSANDEIEKLAQKLATEYMSKNDFIDLSEDDLVSMTSNSYFIEALEEKYQ
jgi:hypothetical protein